MRVVLILSVSLFLCIQGHLTAAYVTKACASYQKVCCQTGDELTASSCCAKNAPSNNESSCQGSCQIDTEPNNTHWQIGSSADPTVAAFRACIKLPHKFSQKLQNVGARSKLNLPLRLQTRIYYSVWRLWGNLCSILFYSVLLDLSFWGQQSLIVVRWSWGSHTYWYCLLAIKLTS